MIEKKAIGKRIFQIRNDNNLTQDEFAKKLEIKRSAVSQLENGIIAPSLDLIHKICITFKSSADWIIAGKSDGLFKHSSIVLSYGEKLNKIAPDGVSEMPIKNEETIALLKSIIKEKEAELDNTSQIIKYLEEKITSNKHELDTFKKLLEILERKSN